MPVPGLSGVLFLALLLLRPVIDKGCFQKAVSTPPRSTDFGLNVASGRHCAEAGRREAGGTWGGSPPHSLPPVRSLAAKELPLSHQLPLKNTGFQVRPSSLCPLEDWGSVLPAAADPCLLGFPAKSSVTRVINPCLEFPLFKVLSVVSVFLAKS